MIRDLIIFIAVVCSLSPARALDCVDADPTGVVAAVYGNFEIHADPDDPASNAIYINHVHEGPSSIVVARVDGATGKFIPGTLTDVADNFQGQRAINGPEFVLPPGKGLGILYRALDGVHGVFRPQGRTRWNKFTQTIAGRPSTMNPPPLPSTYKRSYDAGGLKLGQNTYALIEPPCSATCYADMRGGVPTDAAAVFERQRLFTPGMHSLTQGSQDGNILAYLCTKPIAAADKSCGLYNATIDTKGGFTADPTLVATLPLYVGHMTDSLTVGSILHPATGETIIFVNASHESGQAIDIYRQAKDGSPATLIASVPASGADHFRLVDNKQSTVLMVYHIDAGNQSGSYGISVSYAPNQGYVVGSPTLLTSVSRGSDITYLPAAGHFAIYYRTSERPSRITRCFVDP